MFPSQKTYRLNATCELSARPRRSAEIITYLSGQTGGIFPMRQSSRFCRRLLAVSFIVSIIGPLPFIAAQAQQQKRVIIVNAEQPNVWTLEQAHYLLAQMHRRNLDLRAKKLEDLDANEINGLRFDILRQLIEF